MCTMPKGTITGGNKSPDEIISPANKSANRSGEDGDNKFNKFLTGFQKGGGEDIFNPQYTQGGFMPMMLNDPQDPGAGALTQSILAKILGQTGAY